MKDRISRVQIVPIKPVNDLLGFVSFILDDSFYFGAIGIHSTPSGRFRLTYPTRKHEGHIFPIYHPINKETADSIEAVIGEKYRDVLMIVRDGE